MKKVLTLIAACTYLSFTVPPAQAQVNHDTTTAQIDAITTDSLSDEEYEAHLADVTRNAILEIKDRLIKAHATDFNIKFVKPIKLGFKNSKDMNHEPYSLDKTGAYSFETDSLFIDPSPIADNEAVSYLDHNRSDLPLGAVYPFSSILSFEHQLGHDYFYQRLNFLAKKGILNDDYLRSGKLFTINAQMIKEGIANYFKKHALIGSNEDMSAHEISVSTMASDLYAGLDTHIEYYNTIGPAVKSAFENPDEKNLTFLYNDIGTKIIADIFAEVGVPAGIDAILTSPLLTDREAQHPQDYAKRIISRAEHAQRYKK